MRKMNKKAQEEIVGFALIIILIAVILLVFISFSVKRDSSSVVESYEIQSFISAMLQCDVEEQSVRELIKECDKYDENCELLETKLQEILLVSWQTGEDSAVKAYDLDISSKSKEILRIKQGNETANSKGAEQQLGDIKVRLYIYV